MNKPEKNARAAVIIELGFSAASYTGGLPAYFLYGEFERLTMLALGFPNMAWLMLVFASLFKPGNSLVRIPLVAIFAVLIVLFHAPTAGTSPFSVLAEFFPHVIREADMAVSIAVNLLGCVMPVLVFPFVLKKIGLMGASSIVAALNVVAFSLVYLLCPETRMRKLEELQDSALELNTCSRSQLPPLVFYHKNLY